MNLTIYLARPMAGLPISEFQTYYKKMHKKFAKMGYSVLQPMTDKEFIKTDSNVVSSLYDYSESSNHAIIERDHWMINKCDVVFANLIDAKKVSIGTVSEIAWAYHLNKHIVVSMEPGNIHEHAFIFEELDILYDTEKKAINYLNKLINKNF